MPKTSTTAATTTALQTSDFSSARNDGDKPVSDAAIVNERQRIAIPLDPTAWDHVRTINDAGRDLLRWFHLHALGQNFDRNQIAEIIGLDATNSRRVLTGAYAGSFPRVVQQIKTYKAKVEEIAKISSSGVKLEVTGPGRMIREGLDYALHHNEFALIVGESGMGKTFISQNYALEHAGRVTMMRANRMGGSSAFLRQLAVTYGMGRKMSSAAIELRMKEMAAHSKGRISLVIDQADRIMPNNAAHSRRNAMKYCNSDVLEFLMDLVDEGMGVALLMTQRGAETLNDSGFQEEQITGRSLLLRCPEFERREVVKIINQFGDFKKVVVDQLFDIAKAHGRLRILVKILKRARRSVDLQIYEKVRTKKELSDADILKAIDKQRKHQLN